MVVLKKYAIILFHINKYNQKLDSTEKEKEIKNLLKYPLIELIQYIKNAIDIIITIKLKEELEKINEKNDKLNPAREYELLLQKEEKNCREHISIEHQFRIQCEKYIDEINDLEQENNILLIQIVIIFILNIIIY